MEDKKCKLSVSKKLTDDQLEQVAGGMDALPVDQLDHAVSAAARTSKLKSIILDN